MKKAQVFLPSKSNIGVRGQFLLFEKLLLPSARLKFTDAPSLKLPNGANLGTIAAYELRGQSPKFEVLPARITITALNCEVTYLLESFESLLQLAVFFLLLVVFRGRFGLHLALWACGPLSGLAHLFGLLLVNLGCLTHCVLI